jgi:hypothetical protein
MTEEMRNLSRVKGEERQLFRHTVREKQAYDTVLVPPVPTQRTVSTFRARAQARVATVSRISDIHFGCESALPRATCRRLTPT